MTIVWVCVSVLYLYQYTFPSGGKTFLCIYSIYIISVSFAYNMQTATWWSDSTDVHLKGAGGQVHVKGRVGGFVCQKECWCEPQLQDLYPVSTSTCNLSPLQPSCISPHFCRHLIVHQYLITQERLLQLILLQFLYLHNDIQSPAHLYHPHPPPPPPPNQLRLISDYANLSDVLEKQIPELKLEIKKNSIFDPTGEWECVCKYRYTNNAGL